MTAPIWLTVALVLFSAGAAFGTAVVVFHLSRFAKQRDDDSQRRDEVLERIDASISKLADRVGVQNGRVGKLEEWKAGVERLLEMLERRVWDGARDRRSERREPDRDEGGRP